MQNIIFKLMIALFVFMPGSQFHINAYTENVDVVNKGFSLNELKGKTSFNCFIPKEIAKDWNIELKYPSKYIKIWRKYKYIFE